MKQIEHNCSISQVPEGGAKMGDSEIAKIKVIGVGAVSYTHLRAHET